MPPLARVSSAEETAADANAPDSSTIDWSASTKDDSTAAAMDGVSSGSSAGNSAARRR